MMSLFQGASQHAIRVLRGVLVFLFKPKLTLYFRLCDFSNHFDQNECHELFRGPFNIQISVSIDVQTQTHENEEVFWTQACF